jgi:hypothetical protein
MRASPIEEGGDLAIADDGEIEVRHPCTCCRVAYLASVGAHSVPSAL